MMNSPVAFHNINDLLKTLNKNTDHKHIKNDFFIIDETSDFCTTPYPYPFRTDNSAIILIMEGNSELQINFETLALKPNDMLIIPANATIYPSDNKENVKIIGIVFSDIFVQKNIRYMNYVNEIIFFSEKNTPVLHPTDRDRETFKFLIRQIDEADDRDDYYSKDLINHYFNSIVLEIMTIYRYTEKKMIDTTTSRRKEIVYQFLDLLSKHSRKERTVEFYAEQLSVTPSYLTRVIKEASGDSTREIITNSLIMEARDLLLNSSLSVAQISEELNFSDQSFFGKFFKKKMKISPKTFRVRNK